MTVKGLQFAFVAFIIILLNYWYFGNVYCQNIIKTDIIEDIKMHSFYILSCVNQKDHKLSSIQIVLLYLNLKMLDEIWVKLSESP